MYSRGEGELPAIITRMRRMMMIIIIVVMTTMTMIRMIGTKQLFVFPSTGEVRSTCRFPTEEMLPG